MIRTLIFIALASLAVRAAHAGPPDPEDPQAIVFLRKLPRDEGAPAKGRLSDLVVLSEVGEGHPYYPVVEALQKAGAKEVIPFDPKRMRSAFKQLAKTRPGNVAVVVLPETLDVHLHFELLERASQLDEDPFVDFAFGYFTGATPEEALAFAERAIRARRAKLARSILEFGPSTRPAPLSGENPHSWAEGFNVRRFYHPHDSEGVCAEIQKLSGVGILSASGHGMPDGVAHGLTGAQIRGDKLQIEPALYFSGPCYCGVTSGWYGPESGRYREHQVAREESFLLAMLQAGAVGIFAGLDPDRGETNNREREDVIAGEPLGMASKGTYDDAVLAYRKGEFELPRYEAGKGAPFRNIHDNMISGAACRALFGDPTLQPFPEDPDDPFEIEQHWTKKGCDASWSGSPTGKRGWRVIDICRAGGGWTHRLRFQFEVPLAKAKKLRKFEVVAITKDGQPLDYTYPTAALEVWGGKAYMHVLVIFPPNPDDRALWGGKSYEARFHFK